MALLTTGSSGITGQYQKYFSKKLLPHAVQLLVLAQFGQKVPFPREQGATQIRFTRGDVASAANVLAGGEGVPTTTFRDYTYTFIDATLVEYEIAAKISDVLSWTNLFDTLKNMTGVMGEDVALHADGKIRDTIVAGVTGTGNKRYTGTTQTFAGLAALTGGVPSATGALVLNDILDAMTRLTITRAPQLNGEYVFIVGPQVARDILADPKVLLAGQYGTSKSLMTGEIGRWYGVRIVKHTNPFIENGANVGSEGTYDATATAANAIYRSFAMGTDGFGIPQMGGLSPFNPQMMICDKPDKSDPTNRFITAGLKTYWVAVVLNSNWIVSVSSKSAYAG
jgi:N4-gp56 family major capsid protein